LSALRVRLEAHALLIAALCAAGAVSVLMTPLRLRQDAWLALVDGRYVAAHGLPSHDPFGVLTHGVRWVDQQWLSQLALYGIDRLGGLALYSGVTALLAIGTLALAIAAARRLGGQERHVMLVLPLAGVLYCAGALAIRTQSLAYPLFLATLWLLVYEARRPSARRIYLVLPLLLLWGNLHGSAALGAGVRHRICVRMSERSAHAFHSRSEELSLS
jgi:hypothetical protein